MALDKKRANDRIYSRNRMKYAHDNNLCNHCLKPLPEGYTKKGCPECLAQMRAVNYKKGYRWLKLRAMNKISDNNPVCINCGCNLFDALEINHKNGGGAQERKTLPNTILYQDIVQGRRDPSEFNVMCMVCNRAEYATRKTGLHWKITFER